MTVQTTTNTPPSPTPTANSSNSTLDFNSLVYIDMKKYSQSELYSLSLSSSFLPETDVIPNINSNHLSSTSTTTTSAATPRRIYAFSHRRGPRRRNSDAHATENRLILNSIQKLVTDGDSNPRGAISVQKRKRKRKLKSNEDEFEGLGVVNVDGEVIDVRFLARDADGAFETELNRMTEGMVSEDQFLGFLNGLDGRWGSSRRRRKYVDATVFVKALPVNWKVLLSLRPRIRQPSLYCRRFVSPSDVHFNSCKDVAVYLKSQFVTSNANPPKEGAMMQTEPNRQVELGSKYHGDHTLIRKCSVPRGLLLIREPCSVKPKTGVANKDTVTRRDEHKNISVNGEGSSSEAINNSEGEKDLKTRCIWCLVEFFREPVDAETLASSCGFICPKCKDDVSWRFESSLSGLTQHADN